MTRAPMTRAPHRSLVVGIGSAHGDDQAGWQLIDALKARKLASSQLRKASVPHHLMDWLADCDSLHVVDAWEGDGAVLRLDVSGGCITCSRKTRSSNSHQLSIGGVIELADSLGLLPERVMLWAIPGQAFGPNGEIGDRCMQQVELCANRIQRELADA